MDPLANKYIQIGSRKNQSYGPSASPSAGGGVASAATAALGPQYMHQYQSQQQGQPYETGSGTGGFQNVLKQLSDQRSKIDEILLKSRNYQANKMRLSLDDDTADAAADNDDADESAYKIDDKSEYTRGGNGSYNHHVTTPSAHHPASQTVEDLRRKISELKNQNKPDPKAPRLRSNQTLPHRNKSVHNSSKKAFDGVQNLSHRSIEQYNDGDESANDNDPTEDRKHYAQSNKRRSMSTHNQPEGLTLPPISNPQGVEGSATRTNQRVPSQSQLMVDKSGRNSSQYRRSPSVYSQKQLQWLRSVQNERSKAIQRIYVQSNPPQQGQPVRKFNQQEQQFRDSFMNEMNTKMNANRMVGMTLKSNSKSKKKKPTTQKPNSVNNSNNARLQQQQQGYPPAAGQFSQDELLHQLYQNGANGLDYGQPSSFGTSGLDEFSYYNRDEPQNGSRDAAGLVKIQPNPLNFIAYQSDFESLIERQSEETMEILDYVFESSKNKPKTELLSKLNEFKANFTLHAEKQDKQLREIKRQHRYFQTFDVPRDYLSLDE